MAARRRRAAASRAARTQAHAGMAIAIEEDRGDAARSAEKLIRRAAEREDPLELGRALFSGSDQLIEALLALDGGTTVKRFVAMIWTDDDKPGIRVSVDAADLDDAKKTLEEEYGRGNVFNLHNPEDAERPR